MNRPTKAVLLSCFVFPGAGHLYLKRFTFGLLLSAGAATAAYFIASSAVDTAFEIAQKIQGGGVPLDMGNIAEMLSQQSSSNEESANAAPIALLAFWLIGIFDSYRVGRALEKAARDGG